MHSSDHQIQLAQWTAQRIKEIIVAHHRDAQKILDVGCGSGLITHYVQDILWESKVVGVDRDQPVIKNAQEAFPEIRFFTSDGQLPFEDASFDCVYASYVFHHLKTDDQKKLLHEMIRVLTPNGLLIILEFNPWHIPTRWHFWRNPEEKNAQMIAAHSLKKIIGAAGATPICFYFNKLFFLSAIYAVIARKKDV
ncbi:MAG TPA: class I SAM-dependent methyltransferase [Candidatus Babeliales bacterium]|nr:class I SAM-dependent methyltransferase [Candidatus Babeliales bacterium]